MSKCIHDLFLGGSFFKLSCCQDELLLKINLVCKMLDME